MGSAFAYFFVGFFSALVAIELTDGKPAKKVDYYKTDYYQVRYIYRPFPSGYQHYDYRNHGQDTFNNQRRSDHNQGNSRVETTGRSHSGNTFNHTEEKRTESWGNKN